MDITTEELGTLEPWPLYLRYLEEQMAFGRVALEVQRRRARQRLYVPAEEAPLLTWGPGTHMIVSPERGFDIYAFNIFLEHIPVDMVERQELTSAETVCYCITGQSVEVIGGRRWKSRAATSSSSPPSPPAKRPPRVGNLCATSAGSRYRGRMCNTSTLKRS